MNRLRTWLLPLVITSLSVAAVVTARAYKGTAANVERNSGVMAETQDLTSLERRISLLEQRFYGIETSIRSLEQQSRLSQGTQSPSAAERTLEIDMLRGEIEALQRRMIEIECGLSKLDERTLSTTAREARRRAAANVGTDPCRLNSDAPLKLSTRP